MAFAPVTWAYKDLITSSKLSQMVANLLAHDHRSDGSQGAPIMAGRAGVRAVFTAQSAYQTALHTLVTTPALDLTTVASVLVVARIPAFQINDATNAGHRYFTQVKNKTDNLLVAGGIGRIWATAPIGYSFDYAELCSVVDVSSITGSKQFELNLDPAGKSMRVSAIPEDPVVLSVTPVVWQ